MVGRTTKVLMVFLLLCPVVLAFMATAQPDIQLQTPGVPAFFVIVCRNISPQCTICRIMTEVLLFSYVMIATNILYTSRRSKKHRVRRGIFALIAIIFIDAVCLIGLIVSSALNMALLETTFSLKVLILFAVLELLISAILFALNRNLLLEKASPTDEANVKKYCFGC